MGVVACRARVTTLILESFKSSSASSRCTSLPYWWMGQPGAEAASDPRNRSVVCPPCADDFERTARQLARLIVHEEKVFGPHIRTLLMLA